MSIRTYLDHTPDIADSAFIDESAVVTGRVAIGEDASVWPLCSVRGDVHDIHIGARTNIQDNSVLHVTHDGDYAPGGYPLIIGDDVTVGHGVIVHACTVGNRCLIGMGSIVLDGAIIEDEVMLGAGSLVSPRKTLESGYLYVGSPAKKVRELNDKERAFFKYSAEHYVKLAKQHKS